MTSEEPATVERKVTLQVAVPGNPGTRVQGLPLKDPPTSVWLKRTVPAGVVGVVLVSVTVAVQVDAWLITMAASQLMEVVVA